ncbi:sulfur carrier protein ThiS [Roseateles noduli]|uniref:sulfur carrier protein ThiS n=1 Tax=Roseateles noduli TaxID=2052484 RepID=UPI003D65E652
MNALPRITVRLDDRAVAMPAGATLAQLLELERREADAVATALNGRFVARDARAGTALNDGDVVLFFQPIVGG